MGQMLPQVVVNAREQALRVGLPGPLQIVGQLAQAVDAPRQVKMIGDTRVKIGHSGTIIPPIISMTTFQICGSLGLVYR